MRKQSGKQGNRSVQKQNCAYQVDKYTVNKTASVLTNSKSY
ncbi:hypothetical protein HMPREF1981_02971 [Bacteroides pyogenes F0041]|uniref:Uncharacterized protein n=1 Tax=Bacteroides pyogenes F0041 TaxID=1321819 RepID=U2CB90_9BACE|nr:hypothetical protein HMPREF1981_02971 [Bacteroides pyogenes F0041]